jgi:hypothetical protein
MKLDAEQWLRALWESMLQFSKNLIARFHNAP